MEELKIQSTGKIREVEIGVDEKKIKIGGQNCFNFHKFEGEIPNSPIISFEITDTEPNDWDEVSLSPFKDVVGDPLSWCKKCIEEFDAKILTVHLKSGDPNGENRSVDEIGKTVEKIVKEIDIPLIFWGCENNEKDKEILRRVAEISQGKNVAIGPCVDKNYKQIGAAVIGYGHNVIASTPIDVNLAKQLNILLIELGVPENRIIMDPTTGALGYGIEYTYSVMERDRIASLIQGDDKLGFPMFCFLSKEVWKIKELTIPEEIEPKIGKIKERGIMWESITAILLLLAGADIVVIRHPESAKIINDLINSF